MVGGRKIALARLPDGVRVAFGVRPAGVLAAWRLYRLAIRWLPHQQILCSRSEVDTVASSRLESHSDHLTSANPILLPCAHGIGYLSNTACLHGRPIPTRRFRPPLIMTQIAIHPACDARASHIKAWAARAARAARLRRRSS